MGRKVKIYGAMGEDLWGIGERIWERLSGRFNPLKYIDKYGHI